MNVLCFDIATGGLTAAIFNEDLAASNVTEIPWEITIQPDGAAVLDVSVLEEAVRSCVRARPLAETAVDAISFSAFMHSCIVLDAADRPLTPIFTWMDRRGASGVDFISNRLGSRFHEITGCRYHPMFPVFKLAELHLPGARRIAAVKSWLIYKLANVWLEDHGTASATGLYDVRRGEWSDEVLRVLDMDRSLLLPLAGRSTVAGCVTAKASVRYGIGKGIPLAVGSGDGFLANLGSGCEDRKRMSVSLGTSCSVRQALTTAVLDDSAGTFCYRAGSGAFLLGCAGSNGGNVLDWARSIFGALPTRPVDRTDLPAFIPLLNGERSPEWDASLKASWHDVTSIHTAEDLATAVIDGVAFNLAHYVEIVERASGVKATQFVLSGNGFLNPLASQTFASVVDAPVLQPRNLGLASLRGAAVCGFQALGLDVRSRIDSIVRGAAVIEPVNTSAARRRYRRYRELREHGI